MSLIQVYESTSPQRFSAKFDSPIVIPRSGRITLTKAHIPRLRQLTISEGVNDTMGVMFHDEQPTTGLPRFYQLKIADGNYTPQALCTALNAQFIALKQTWLATAPFNGQFAEANLRFSWNGSHFELRASCDSIYLDFWAQYTPSLPNNTWDWRAVAPAAIVGQTAPVVCDRVHGTVPFGGTVACTNWADALGRLSAWNNAWHEGNAIRRKYWDSYPDPLYAPSYQHPFSGGKWTNSIAGAAVANVSSYWVGLSENDATGIGVSGVTNGNMGSLDQMTGVDYAVMVCSETTGVFVKGKCYVFEQNQATGQMLLQTSAAAAAGQPDIQTGDQICIVLPENSDGRTNHCEYWVKPAASASWTAASGAYTIDADIQPLQRPVPAEGTQLYICGGFYQDTNGVAGAQTIDHQWGLDPATAYRSVALGGGFFNHFGQRAQIYLADQANRAGADSVAGTIGAGDPPAAITTALGATMGFTQPAADLLLESAGTTPLSATVVAATAATLEVPTDTRPIVNVNITNLPIVSAAPSFENAATLAPPLTQHGFTRTVACLPRFGGAGNNYLNEFEDEIVSYGDNTQTIKLRNVDSIQLNSLDVELRNCDGSIPQDLGVPAVFCFHIDGAAKGEDDLV